MSRGGVPRERQGGNLACVCHREKRQAVFAYVGGRSKRKGRGKKNDMGNNPYWFGGQKYLVIAATPKKKKFTRKRTPLLRNMPHWIVHLAHADGDSAVWERRRRKQDKSALVPKRWCCGKRTRLKKNPTSVSVWRCVRPGMEG